MRICLINPSVIGVLEPWYDTPDFGRAGLAYLAGYLRKVSDFELKIIDAKLEQLNFDQVTGIVQEYQPDVVGLTAFTNEIKPAAYQAARIKLVMPNVVTVIGGVHVTSLPQDTLKEFPAFDIGVVGEGEITFYELCSSLNYSSDFSRIDGLVYRHGIDIVSTKPRQRIANQDSIPFPAWDLLPASNTYYIQSERGCPFSCIFCMNPNGKVPRKRSVENVIDELNWVINTFRPQRISFGDELFSVDMQRTAKLLNAMADNKIGDRVKWDVQTHVHFVDEELFRKFKKAGVQRVELGIETGDEQALRKMGKGTNLDKIMQACSAAKSVGVKIGTFFLLGQPNETVSSIQSTINLAVKLNPDLPMFGLMTPYPGTEVAKMASKGEGGYKILTTDWDEYNKQIGGSMEFANLSRQQIEWIQVKAYAKVYLYNARFIDFVKFIWEYKKGAWEIFKKIVFKRSSLSKHLDRKPSDYNELLQTDYVVHKERLIYSRDEWQLYQTSESKRLKVKLHENLSH